jgi:phytol kinase
MAISSLMVLLAMAGLAGVVALPAPSPITLIGIAMAAASLEQVAIGGLDNLTVPLAVAWLWSQLATA